MTRNAKIALKNTDTVLKMATKDRHKANLIKYLSDWDNDFPKRIEFGAILGVKEATLWRIFTGAELDEIENEALEIRKQNAARPRQEAYKHLVAQFKDSVPAIKEFLDRTEGRVVEKREIFGKGGGPIEIISAIPEPKREEKGE